MNKFLETSAKDFLKIYKDKLHEIGIQAGSNGEAMLIAVLIDTAKQWSAQVQLLKGKK